MAGDTLDLRSILSPETMATEIAHVYDDWKSQRNQAEESWKELRNFVFATDTTSTTNSKLPFKNSTTVPKLAQIRMNLHANLMANLFPQDDEWINWEAHNAEAALQDKRLSIESYIRTKARQQNVTKTFSDLVDDAILYGNCFAMLDYVNESTTDPATEEEIPGFIGPMLTRISPHDIVFNLTASSFKNTPKIIRYLKSIGELIKDGKSKPELGYTEEIINRIKTNRQTVAENSKRISNTDMDKQRGYTADGFGSLFEYYNSDLVEILEFRGDFYNRETGEFLENHIITVVDRLYVARMVPSASWRGSSYIYHFGWNRRPDNLMSMGPLDNLVGMQYKIDKLENLRADVFDMIANPTTVEIGNPEYFGIMHGAPGGRWIADEGGDVKYLQPDATALQADFQIADSMQKMEELAGSPKESMGIRTPGEKTRFEVQVLDNAANRIFRRKVEEFEFFIEEILNDMLEIARRNLDGADLVRAQDTTFGIDVFLEITKEDITAAGKLYPRGSKHILQQANTVQNLNAIFSSQAAGIILPHISRIGLARVIENLLGIEKFKLVTQNQGIVEDIETQRIVQTGQQQLEEESVTEINEEDALAPPV